MVWLDDVFFTLFFFVCDLRSGNGMAERTADGTAGNRLGAARVSAWDRARPVRRVPAGARVPRGVLRRLCERECRCAVCLDTLQRATAVGACLHRFCRPCIEDALRRARSVCPACKAQVHSHRVLRADARFQRLVDFFARATAADDDNNSDTAAAAAAHPCFACSKEAAAALERQRRAVAAAEAEAARNHETAEKEGPKQEQ